MQENQNNSWKSTFLFYPVLLLIVIAGTGAVVLTAYQFKEARTPAFEQIGNLRFHRKQLPARIESEKNRLPLFIEYSANWCEPCHEFEKMQLTNTELNQALGRAVLLKLKDTDNEFNDSPYPGLRDGLPFFVVLDADGKEKLSGHEWKDVNAIVRALSFP